MEKLTESNNSEASSFNQDYGDLTKPVSKNPARLWWAIFILLILVIAIIVIIIVQEDDNPSPSPGVVWVAAGQANTLVGAGGTSWENMLYSRDGKTWFPSSQTGSSFYTYGWGVAYGNARWVTVGNDLPGGSSWGNIMWSDTGTCWVETDNGHSFQIEGRGVDYGGNLWVAAGNNVQPSFGGTSAGNLKWSLDGLCWVNSSGSSFKVMANTVKYNPNATVNDVAWVAGGDNGTVDTNGSIKWSNNGTCWVDSTGNAFLSVNSVTVSDTNPPVWVAVGNEGAGGDPHFTIQYSLTGKDWVPVDPAGAFFQNEGLAVEYGNGIFVATGDNAGNDNILWSDTGTSWNIATGACFAVQGNGIAYGNGLFVATGDDIPGGDSYGNILYSTNGKNWVKTSTGTSFTRFGRGVGYKS